MIANAEEIKQVKIITLSNNSYFENDLHPDII